MLWNQIVNELIFRTSRSSGAGGQHVNKTETKVDVLFQVDNSAGLSDEEKSIIKAALRSRINEEGWLSLSSQKSRSQLSNKEDVVDRLHRVLEKALLPKIKRKKTKPSKESVEERLLLKKQIAEKKQNRRKPEV